MKANRNFIFARFLTKNNRSCTKLIVNLFPAHWIRVILMRQLKNFHVLFYSKFMPTTNWIKDTTLENETFFPFETFTKIKDVHFTRNLHNFVYDITDAWHGTFRFLVKTHPRRPRGSLSGSRDFRGRKFTVRTRRTPGQLLLPNQFQKRLKSPLLIGQKNIFLPNQPRGPAGRLWCLLTRSCFPHQSLQLRGPFNRKICDEIFREKFSEVGEIANFNMATGKQTLTEKFSRRTYWRYRGIVNFYS